MRYTGGGNIGIVRDGRPQRQRQIGQITRRESIPGHEMRRDWCDPPAQIDPHNAPHGPESGDRCSGSNRFGIMPDQIGRIVFERPQVEDLIGGGIIGGLGINAMRIKNHQPARSEDRGIVWIIPGQPYQNGFT